MICRFTAVYTRDSKTDPGKHDNIFFQDHFFLEIDSPPPESMFMDIDLVPMSIQDHLYKHGEYCDMAQIKQKSLDKYRDYVIYDYYIELNEDFFS